MRQVKAVAVAVSLVLWAAAACGAEIHEAAKAGDVARLGKLLAEGADPNSKDEQNNTALHIAAREGHAEAVKLLLGKGADHNARGADGFTALHFASARGHADVVRALLEAGAYVDATDQDGYTPLSCLIRANNDEASAAEVAKVLLDHGAHVNAKSNSGVTPLRDVAFNVWRKVAELLMERGAEPDIYIASMLGDAALVRRFLDGGADVSAKDPMGPIGYTALHWAARKGHAEVAKLLIERKADINAKAERYGTPLDVATEFGHPEVARLLLDAGAECTITAAAMLGDVAKVRELLDKGADVSAKDGTSYTALQHAAMHGQLEVAKLLLDRGADANARTLWGATLHLAANGAVIALLIERGADVDPKSNEGNTPLHEAVQRGNREAAAALLEHGANVNATNNYGLTPLHVAVARRDVEMARLLLEHGADANAKTNEGQTPLQNAGGNEQLASLLRQHGAKGEAVPPAPVGPEPGRVKALVEQATAAKRAGKLDEAEAKLREALKLAPEDLQAHWVLAWTLAESGRKAEVIEEFRKVIELAPEGKMKQGAQAALQRLRRNSSTAPPTPLAGVKPPAQLPPIKPGKGRLLVNTSPVPQEVITRKIVDDFLVGVGTTDSKDGWVSAEFLKGLRAQGINYFLPFTSWAVIEPSPGVYSGNPPPGERSITWLSKSGATLNGHCTLFLIDKPYATPRFAFQVAYARQMEMIDRFIKATVSRFPQIQMWTLNEPVAQNCLGWSREQIYKAFVSASRWIHEVNPAAKVMVNMIPIPCNWSGIEYVPDQVLTDLMKRGLQADVIGIELYYWWAKADQRDAQGYPKLQWVKSRIDLFRKHGLPIIFSEVGVPGVLNGKAQFEQQADWAEAFFRLCHEDEDVKGATWYFVRDDPFMPYAGLANDDYTMRPVGKRLVQLVNEWYPAVRYAPAREYLDVNPGRYDVIVDGRVFRISVVEGETTRLL